ncbi:right-handed parallel beta-helix repeat-containing protein, partial [candidate division KSB1 bacterium]
MTSFITAQTVVFHENFEQTSLGDSVTSSQLVTGTDDWGISTFIANGGLRSDTCQVKTGANTTLTSNSFSTLGNYQVYLEFAHICKVDATDTAVVEVSADGGITWTKLTSSQYLGNGAYSSQGDRFNAYTYVNSWSPGVPSAIPNNTWWRTEQFDISSLAANSPLVQVRFRMADGGTAGPNNHYGWAIDDITISMSFSELDPPSITLTPPIVQGTVYNSGPYNIVADIVDVSGIDTVYLIYNKNGSIFDTVGMLNTTGNSYTGIIDTASNGDSLCYYITAIDASPVLNDSSSATYCFVVQASPWPPGCALPITTFPFVEDFDQNSSVTALCGQTYTLLNDWTNETESANGTDWAPHSGTTGSFTGPNADHTSGSGIYLYIESTGCNGRVAELTSPCLDITGLSNPVLDFWYHMYGTGIGELHVDIYYGGQWINDIMTPLIGQQQTASTSPWLKATVNLSAYKSVTKVRFRGITLASGVYFYGDIAIDDMQVYDPPAYDAGVISIDAPVSPATPGIQPVQVTIQNFSPNVLDSCYIYYSVNGVLQTPYVWTGSLSTNGTDTATIGTYNFQGASSVIKAWTNSPNGQTDGYNYNDTTEVTIIHCTGGLSGTYTIGGANPDFSTFSDALNALVNCNVGGSVVFNVASGTYTEQLSFPSLTGSSSTNTVTFQSVTGVNTDVVLQYAASSSTDNYVVQLNGADYFIFKNMTIKALGTTYARVVVLESGANNNEIRGNVLQTAVGANFYAACIYSGTSVDERNFIVNNNILNGYYGLYLTATTSNLEEGNIIQDNYVTGFYYYGIYVSYQDSIVITHNTVENYTSSSLYPMYLYNCDNGIEVSYNNVEMGATSVNYGIRLYYCDGSASEPGKVYNNFVSQSGASSYAYGITTYISNYQNVYFNSVNITGGSATNGRAFYQYNGSNINVLNNIFSNTGGGYAYYAQTSTAINTSDYNNIYATGVNLAYWGTNVANLAALQSASSKDAHSLSVLPGYVSVSDLHVNNAYLDSAGTAISGISTDYDGDTRNATHPDIGADEFAVLPSDAGIFALIEPVAPCAGSVSNVTVELKNYGTDTLNLATIFWQVNGVMKDTVVFSGALLPNSSTNVVLDTFTFAFGTVYDIKTWTSNPNGFPDGNNGNDTLLITGIKTALGSGTYTIGGGGADYPTFTDAVNDMISTGICGPVVFNVSVGTYSEHIQIPEILGASSTNTITFQSATGDSTDVILTYSAGSTADNYVVEFTGGDYIKFNKITIKATGSTYGRCVVFSTSANYNEISNCIIESPVATSSMATPVYSSTSVDEYNIIKNNVVSNGYYGIYFYGSSGSLEKGNIIEGNILTGFTYYGMYMIYQDSCTVSSNTVISSSSSTTAYGITLYYSDNINQVSKNNIQLNANSSSGLRLYYCDATSTRPAVISNNFISIYGSGTSTCYGIYNYNSTYADYYFNSINVTAGSSTSYAYYSSSGSSIKVINNIMVNTGGGYAYYNSTSSAITSSNYNDIYATGTYLAYWSGSHTTLSSLQTASGKDGNSVSVNPGFISLTDLHVNNVFLDSAATPISGISEDFDGDTRNTTHPDIGADEFVLVPADAGILSLVEPTAPCSGNTVNVSVELMNYGTDTLTSAWISWEVNGVPKTSVIFSGSIPPSQTDTVFLDTMTFYSGINYNLKFWSSSPNALPDGNSSNDTLLITGFTTALSGSYTIGGTSADYPNFTAAVNDINTMGVCGPVVFNVTPGTYNENISIQAINGASAINTVTFQSATADSNDVILTYASSGTGNNYVVELNGADYVTFRQMTIKNTGITYARIVVLRNGANYNTISNNVIQSTSTSYYSAGVYNYNTVDQYNMISNNLISGGYYGCYYSGASTTNLETGNMIVGNTIIDFYIYGIYAYTQDSIIIRSNYLQNLSTSGTVYALYLYYCDNGCRIEKNTIYANGSTGSYGIRNYYNDGTTTEPGIIANNFVIITGGTTTLGSHGLYCYYSTNQRYYYNSVNVISTNTSSSGFYQYGGSATSNIQLRNNILSNTGGGFAYDVNTTSAINSSDYNDLYTTGNNVAVWGTTNCASLAVLQTASSMETNSLSVNPGFLSSTDLHIFGAALNGMGIPVSAVTEDIDGDLRDLITPDIGADEFTPSPYDIGALELVTPMPSMCYSAAETVTIRIINYGNDSINFANDTATLYVSVTGANPYNFAPIELNSGILAIGGTLDVVVATNYFMSFTGNYHFSAFTVMGSDGNPQNDSMTTTTITVLPSITTLPFTENFETFTTGSPGVLANGWTTYPTTTYTYRWEVDAGGTTTVNTGPDVDHTLGTASGIYVFTEANYGNVGDAAYMISPCFDFTATTSPILTFWYYMYGSDVDSLIVEELVSNTWINTPFMLAGQQQTSGSAPWLMATIPLSPNAKKIRFKTTRGGYYGDIAIDDINLYVPSPYDLGAIALSTPLPNTCYSSTEVVTVQVKNLGTDTLNFAIDTAYLYSGVTGTNPSTFPMITISTGILLPNDTLDIVVSTNYNMSSQGTYSFYAYTSMAIDGLPANDSMPIQNVAVSSKIDLFPHTEDFQTFTPGAPGTLANDWTTSPSSGFRWEVQSGPTTSFATGPANDHTYGNSNGIYLYTEASSGSQGAIAYLTSPCLDFSGTSSPVLKFWYHMYGSSMGTLELEQMIGGVWSSAGFIKTGQQHTSENDAWTEAIVNLSTGAEKIRFKATRGSSIYSDMAIDDLFIYQPVPDDLELLAWDAPLSGVNLSTNIDVTIKVYNAGSQPQHNYPVYYTINGGTTYTGPEYITDTIQPGDTVTYTFTTQTSMLTQGFYTCGAWVSLATDTVNYNDTLMPVMVYACNPMVGTYTLGGATADFATFDDAITVLQACGVGGHVTFDVTAGTYNTQVLIPEIPGTSDTSMVTFQSATGDSTDVIITYSASSTAENYVLKLNGADYIRIKHMTVRPLGSTYAYAIVLDSNAYHNEITNSSLECPSGTVFYSAGVYSNTTTINNYNTIKYNNIENGYYGIYLYGTSTSNHEAGNIVMNNMIAGFYYMGINAYYQDSLIIVGNTITDAGNSSTVYGVNVYYGDNGFEVKANKIHTQGINTNYSLRIYNSHGSTIFPGLLANNFITQSGSGTGYNYGIYVYAASNLNVFYNSVNNTGTASLTRGFYYTGGTSGSNVQILNNIFVNKTGGYAIYMVTSAALTNCDYNDYFTTGSYLAYWSGNQTDLATLQGVSGLDSNSVSVDPGFVSPTDLHVVNSVLNASAYPITSITMDIDGDIRDPLTPDIGADEFIPPPLDIGCNSLVAPMTGVCYTSNETVILAVQNYGSDTLDFSQDTATIFVNVTGPNPQVFTPIVLTSGILFSGDTMHIIISSNYDMSAAGTYVFNANTQMNGDMNLFNDTLIPVSIIVSTPITQYPHTEDFQTFITGQPGGMANNWITYPSTGYRWEVTSGTTPSFGTGPSNDHTLGTASGIYVFGEASLGALGDMAYLESPCLQLDTMTKPHLKFWYHMYGAGTGTLEVEQLVGGVWTSTGLAIVGQQQSASGDPWLSVDILLPLKPDKIRFKLIRGNTLQGDMAIDDIYIYEPIPISKDAGIADILSPTGGCGLTTDTVTIKYYNDGVDTIFGNLVVGYYFAGSTSVITEIVPDTINPGDTTYYSFNTLINLATTNDTTFTIIAFTALPGDTTNSNDTTQISLFSGVPAANPIVSNVIIPYGTSTTIAAMPGVPSDSLYWFDVPVGGLPIGSGIFYTTPVLYNTATFYVEAIPGGNSADYTIGNGTVTNTSGSYPAPYGNYWWGARHQMLIRASELISNGMIAGPINSLAFDVVNTAGTPLTNFEIRMAHTTVNQVANWQTSGFFTVFSASSYTETTGWNVHNFSAPFVWDGVSNIIIETCFNNSSWTSNATVRQTATSYNSTIEYHQDASGICTSANVSAIHQQRPNIRFNAAAQSCPSNRVPLTVFVMPPPPIDAGVIQITQPTGTVTSGIPIPVEVAIKNFGTDTLISATISWSVNGVPKTPYSWTGTLLHDSVSTPFIIGTDTFYNGQNCITAWTSMPNSQNDTVNINDTTTSCFYACLSGTYTLGSPTSDFPTFADALTTLDSAGVCGAVIFLVDSGTYNVQLGLHEILGASAINTITFRSATGDSSDVIITYAASGGADNYVVLFDGADYFRFEKVSIIAGGTTYARAVVFSNGADYNNVSNCFIQSSAATNTNAACVYSGNTLDEFNMVSNNNLSRGYYGIYFSGVSTTSLERNNMITGNTVKDFSTYGIYTYCQDSVIIKSNIVENIATTNTIYGIYAYYCDRGIEIVKNRINLSGSNANYGILNYYCDALPAERGLIANNFITYSGTSLTFCYGVYNGQSSYQNYYYNSINIEGTSTNTRGFYHFGGSNVNVSNNIFVNKSGGYAYYIGTTTSIITSDYNDIYTTGTNYAYWGGARANLSALQTASSKDANSISVDPGYTSSANLHISNVALNAAATPITIVSDDIDGDQRDPLTPDIGADEFIPAPYDLGVIDLVAPVSGQCYSSNEIVSVIIKNFGTDTMNFAVDTAYIYATVTGPNPVVFPAIVLDTGFIGNGDSLLVIISTNYDMSLPGTYVFNATTTAAADSNTGNNAMLPVSVVVSQAISVLPHTENFETYTPGAPGTLANGWTSRATSSFRWQVDNGGTPSGSTGPSVDHTLGNSSGIYMYTEASGSSTGDTAFLISPCFNFTNPGVTVLEFWYHMYGSTMGTLEVEQYIGGAWYSTSFALTGQQQTSGSAPWIQASLYLSPNAERIRFKGTRGSNYFSDMAVDDINIFQPPPLDMGVLALVSPVSGQCYGTKEVVNIKIQNFGSDTIYFFNDTTYLHASVTGPNPTTFPTVMLTTGFLVSGDTLDVIVDTSYNMSSLGTYVFNAHTIVTGDGNGSNDTMMPLAIVVDTMLNTYPYIENFETFSVGTPGTFMNGWKIEPTTGYRWQVNSGGTPSLTTGPDVDHTFGNSSGKYVYTEGSAGNQGDNAILTSPCLNLVSMNAPTLSFWYHMYGTDIDSVIVEQFVGGVWIPTGLAFYGQQQTANGSPWLKAVVGLNSLADKIRFRVIRGAYVYCDVSIDDINIYEPAANDLEMVAWVNPQSPASPSAAMNISVRIYNAGSASQTNFPVYYTINNGTSWTGPEMVGDTIYPGDTITYNYTTTANMLTAGLYNCGALVSLSGDVDHSNDTLLPVPIFVCSPLAGTYTIGGTTADFSTFSLAVDALINCGVGGDVIFNVDSGTYIEQISIPEILGVSDTSTVTFQSSTGDSTDVVIAYGASATADNFVIRLEGADYFTFKNITINANGASYARAVVLENSSNNNIFTNNIIQSIQGANFDAAGIYSGNSMDERNRILNNRILNGYYGVYMSGNSTSNLEQSNIIVNNEIKGFYYYGIYAYQQDSVIIKSNEIENDTSSNAVYGIMAYYCDGGFEFTKNQIYVHGSSTSYGMYIYFCDGTSSERGLVANNFITENGSISGTLYTYGIYFNSTNYVNVLYNSVNIMGLNTNSRSYYLNAGSNINLINNILVNKGGGVAMMVNTPSALVTSDYNNLYVTGVNIANWNGSGYATLGDLQTASSKDAHSISVDPLYYSVTDLHVNALALNGAAVPLSVITDDIDGDTRNASTPDIGADEFSPSSKDVGAIALTLPVTGGCYSSSELVQVQIQNLGIDTIDFGIDTVTVYASVTGPNPQTFSPFVIYSGLLTPGASVNIIVSPNYNMSLLGNYVFTAYTKMGSDGNNLNDTLQAVTINVFGNISTYPYTEDFETFVTGTPGTFVNGWTTFPALGYRWEVDNGGTSSQNTGPSADHTYGTAGGKYVFGEASQGSQGDVAHLVSPCLDFSGMSNPAVSFWYHMYGATIDSLILQQLVGGTWISTGFTMVGQQQTSGTDPWLNAIVNLDTLADKIRFKITKGSSYTGDIAIDDVNIYEPGQNDLAVIEWVAPQSGVGVGNNTVTIKVFNAGLSTQFNFPVYFTVDSGYNWVGPETVPDTIAPGDTVSYTFTNTAAMLTTGLYYCGAAVTLTSDNDHSNDTLFPVQVYACSPLIGTYTVGGTSSDFASVNNAVDALINCGVGGHVVFEIDSGTYYERISIPEIMGASDTSTITFKSATGDSTDVVITWGASGTADNFIVQLDGADYVTLKNLTIWAQGATYGRVVVIENGATHNTITNNVLRSIIGTGTGSAGIYSTGDNDDYTQISNNLIENGYYGILLQGAANNNLEEGNIITGNTLKDFYTYGIYTYRQDSLLISENILDNIATSTTIYGIDAYYCDNYLRVLKNKVHVHGTSSAYGIYVSNCDGTSSVNGLIANNFITQSGSITGFGYGIYSTNNSYQNFYYNSINIVGTSTDTRAFYHTGGNNGSNLKLVNNILANYSGGYALRMNTGAAMNTADYNDLYTNGTNLVIWNNTNYATLAAYQTGTSTGTNSISVDPNYPALTDLHINNPALDSVGTPLTQVSDDIDGDARDASNPDIGADEFSQSALDAGAIAIVSPTSPSVIGLQNVSVIIGNFGLTTMTSVTIAWEVNGTPQTSYSWTGSLPQNGTDSVTIGSYNFPMGITHIKAWTTSPNGSLDGFHYNDTTEIDIYACPGALSGTYTIGGINPDFPDVLAAHYALDNCGISGPVVFNIAPGTYTNQHQFTPVSGASATNTITFQSSTGDSTDVILTFASLSSSDNYVVRLHSGDYFI